MRTYFLKTNNTVIITNGETAKIFDAAPSGIYEGIDLYSENAAEQLKRRFSQLSADGELNDYQDIYSPNEVAFEDIEEELEDAVLVFEE